MNLHVPQTEEARTEAVCLMGVYFNVTNQRQKRISLHLEMANL